MGGRIEADFSEIESADAGAVTVFYSVSGRCAYKAMACPRERT
jgi:hypothetical protein